MRRSPMMVPELGRQVREHFLGFRGFGFRILGYRV